MSDMWILNKIYVSEMHDNEFNVCAREKMRSMEYFRLCEIIIIIIKGVTTS